MKKWIASSIVLLAFINTAQADEKGSFVKYEMKKKKKKSSGGCGCGHYEVSFEDSANRH